MITWRKASFSFANGNCVEAANLPGGGVGVRDSKNVAGPVLRVSPRAWVHMVTQMKGW